MEQLYAPWDEVKIFCENCDLTFIPTGVVETKGYHQPMGTDAILAEEMAKRLSERIDALVVPTLSIGVSAAGAKSFFGSLHVSSDVYRAYLKEVCECLVHWGLKRFIFFSGHGPNAKPIHDVAWHLKEHHAVRCLYVQFNPFLRPFAEDLCESEDPFVHAGEAEGSVMLHWRPELVKLEKASVVHPKKSEMMPGMEQYEDLEYDYGFMTDTGHLGDPTLATPEKGAVIAERMLAFLEDHIKNHFS